MRVPHICLKERVVSGREGLILGGCLKRGGGSVYWEGWVDFGRVAYRCLKERYNMGKRGRFCESCKYMFKRGVYSRREGQILRGSLILFKRGFILRKSVVDSDRRIHKRGFTKPELSVNTSVPKQKFK